MKTGGQILVDALAAHEVDTVYCVAGESYLPVLDALVDAPAIRTITCRHESGAAFMAETYGLLKGDKPGVVMVTRGPGACNASIGIHAAKQSSSPVVMFVGLIGTAERGKEAFQEFDLPQMFASHTKWAAVIDKPERAAEYVARAFHIARSGRPGPVVLGLPEEMLSATVSAQPPSAMPRLAPASGQEDAARVIEALSGAARPLIIVGGPNWSDVQADDLARFARASHIPVAASFRRQDLVDHTKSYYVGELGTGPNPALLEKLRQADVILALGTRLSEITSQGYTLLSPAQKLIHIYPDAAEFGASYAPDIAVCAHAGAFASVLASKRLDGRGWAHWRDELRALYERWTEIDSRAVSYWKGADMTAIFSYLRDALPEDAIVTTDAGNFSGWAQRYLRYRRPGRLFAPISGAMGYGVPSAICAALHNPEKTVVGFCGDGGFMMSAQELATVKRYDIKPIIIVCNNAMFGTIRMHQERDFPGRVSATDLTNPDFVKLAESFGLYGARVSDAQAFPDVWKRAKEAGSAALIEIVMDPRQITTRAQA